MLTPKGAVPKHVREQRRDRRKALKAAKWAIRREATVQRPAELDENGRNAPQS
jgi:hypothetical protein